MPSQPRRARTARSTLVVLLGLALGLTVATPAGAVAPAPTKAKVRVTLDPAVLGGKVISKRPACERNRTVALFLREPGGEGVLDETQSRPDGGYDFLPQRRAGGAAEALAVAIGDTRCRVAQSVSRPLSRAPQAARVQVSLKGSVLRAPHGRVTSTRAGCFREVTVHFLSRETGSRPWDSIGSTVADEDGRYELPREVRVRRGLSIDYTTVVLGTGRCAVAQSGLLSIAF